MRFSFIFSDSLQGSKIVFNGFYLFGGSLTRARARNVNRARKSRRERATATRERNATPRTAQNFGSSRHFLGSVVLLAGCNGSKQIQAIFHGFTAHGLKARNGSRTPRGSPKAEQGRSDNQKITERKKIPHNFATILSGNCRGNLSY